ncbi:hypothetical protein POM88_016508 [Heracleum sosnowskyi]|uniref:Uncharacterized protein n=1 Tax=Heracleum sosnowskyi TaxID=360622 RepID=A0AAD8IQQ7_9APIA|nr:hypothetical protein POM88_016508 [Heracleum sosnowskyi]
MVNQVSDSILARETENMVAEAVQVVDLAGPTDCSSEVVNKVHDTVQNGETRNGDAENFPVVESEKDSLVEETDKEQLCVQIFSQVYIRMKALKVFKGGNITGISPLVPNLCSPGLLKLKAEPTVVSLHGLDGAQHNQRPYFKLVSSVPHNY